MSNEFPGDAAGPGTTLRNHLSRQCLLDTQWVLHIYLLHEGMGLNIGSATFFVGAFPLCSSISTFILIYTFFVIGGPQFFSAPLICQWMIRNLQFGPRGASQSCLWFSVSVKCQTERWCDPHLTRDRELDPGLIDQASLKLFNNRSVGSDSVSVAGRCSAGLPGPQVMKYREHTGFL